MNTITYLRFEKDIKLKKLVKVIVLWKEVYCDDCNTYHDSATLKIIHESNVIHEEPLDINIFSKNKILWKTSRKIWFSKGHARKIFHRIAERLKQLDIIEKHADLCKVYGCISILNKR